MCKVKYVYVSHVYASCVCVTCTASHNSTVEEKGNQLTRFAIAHSVDKEQHAGLTEEDIATVRNPSRGSSSRSGYQPASTHRHPTGNPQPPGDKFATMKNKDLREELMKRSQPFSGSKAEMADRLRRYEQINQNCRAGEAPAARQSTTWAANQQGQRQAQDAQHAAAAAQHG